jgi:steroid 5-alpha reductase family enzyme
MNLVRTIFFLIFTIVLVPSISFYYSDPLTSKQWEVLYSTLYIFIGLTSACFIVGELTKNVSQVDKVWSLAPIAYAWNIAYHTGFSDRGIIMACLVSIWGLRLTYNFSRRGGYSWKFWTGDEDYRWDVLREKPAFKGKPWAWSLFNLFFICTYQMSLIFLFTLPILLEIDAVNSEVNYIDVIAAVFMLGSIVLETVADQQHFNYQTEKYRKINSGEKLEGIYADGFLSKGLWGKMRHPNYTGEQGTWIAFYLFSVAATGQWINWTITGAALLLVLFNRSSDFSEEITSAKYPKYKDYQKNVPRFLPKLF